MYKESIYNRVLRLNENAWYVHNILSSSECVLFAKEKEAFDNINADNLDEYFSSLRNEWVKMGFFVDQRVDERASLLLERKVNIYSHMKEYAGFVIAPTMNCNARCFYCYEDDTRANIYLSDDTAEKIINYIKENAIGKKKVFISWFGGEPLMNIKHLKRISAEIIDFCKENSIEYDAEVTTNGYFLRDNVALMKECLISEIQVTLDGIEEEHIKRKNFIDGVDSWERIIDGIFQASLNGIHVTVRVNFDKRNFDNVLHLPELLIKNSRWNDNISIYYSPIEANSCGNFHGIVDEEEYKEYFKIIHNKLNDIGYYDIYPQALMLKKRSLPCYSASLSTVAIDCLGNIYHCQHQLCREGQSIGNVRDGIVINQELVEWFDGNVPAKCAECAVLPLCQGGCITKRNLGQEINLCHNVRFSIEAIESIKAKRIKKQFNL